MSRDEARARRHTAKVDTAHIASKSILGVNLGDLRKLVAAAEGHPAGATVALRDLSQSATTKGEYHAKHISVTSAAQLGAA